MTQPIQNDIEAYTEGIVVACRRSDGRWLFIRRSATVRRPLRVCFPGGWIEAGESQAEAVVREMREELNVDVVPVRCVWQHLFGEPPRMLWGWLAKRNAEPSIPVKFGLALVGVGAGFLFLVWGSTFHDASFRVGVWWLAGLYVIHSIAELCISPVGLSMITKLSIARIVGLMMGVWFLSISIGEYLAGAAAQAASVQTVGGQVTNPQLALESYAHTFMVGGEMTMAAGVILLAISPWLRKLMHGVN